MVPEVKAADGVDERYDVTIKARVPEREEDVRLALYEQAVLPEISASLANAHAGMRSGVTASV